MCFLFVYILGAWSFSLMIGFRFLCDSFSVFFVIRLSFFIRFSFSLWLVFDFLLLAFRFLWYSFLVYFSTPFSYSLLSGFCMIFGFSNIFNFPLFTYSVHSLPGPSVSQQCLFFLFLFFNIICFYLFLIPPLQLVYSAPLPFSSRAPETGLHAANPKQYV